jgi:hypothetical protein
MSAEDRSEEGPFAGCAVHDFPGTDPGPGVASRLHIGWDEEVDFSDLVAQLAAHPGATQLEALVIGAFESDSLDDASGAINDLISHASSFPVLRALFFCDAAAERSEISWIDNGNQAKLASAFPNLEVLHIRGRGDGELKGYSSPKLHTLIIETGGLRAEIVRDVLNLDLPALTHLELFLGTPSYEGETSIADLQPLLEGRVHTGLRFLGLKNSEIADEVAFAASRSPLLGWIEELDFSLGTLSDEGFLALSQMGPTPKLRKVNVSHHYAGAGAIEALTTAMQTRGVDVDTSEQEEGDDDDRWVSISE